MKIEARLVADGVGFPPMWLDSYGYPVWMGEEVDQLHEYSVDLSDHQTRAGLLRQLAIWAGDDGEAQAYWLVYTGGRTFGTRWHLKRSNPNSWDTFGVAYFASGRRGNWNEGSHDIAGLPTDSKQSTEALARILEAIGRGEVSRDA